MSGFFRVLSCMFFTQPAAAAEETPQSFDINFDDIRQLSWLGVGAHGCVFLGEYRGRTVAVKKFKELEMTQKEVKHLQMLRHPNIVQFIGVCINPPVFALVMEYCTESLYDLIHKSERRITPRLVLLYATHVARGMQYLHEKSIIHRDLKALFISWPSFSSRF
jgi:serine/threonine protein kinase